MFTFTNYLFKEDQDTSYQFIVLFKRIDMIRLYFILKVSINHQRVLDFLDNT